MARWPLTSPGPASVPESRKIKSGADASRAPLFRAAPGRNPSSSWKTYFSRSRPASDRATSSESSDEPSSATITSNAPGSMSCSVSVSRVLLSSSRRLYVGIMTEALGLSADSDMADVSFLPEISPQSMPNRIQVNPPAMVTEEPGVQGSGGGVAAGCSTRASRAIRTPVSSCGARPATQSSGVMSTSTSGSTPWFSTPQPNSLNQNPNPGTVIAVPSTSSRRPLMPTTPPQVLVPTTGPMPNVRIAAVTMSPSDPANSSATATTGPRGAICG